MLNNIKKQIKLKHITETSPQSNLRRARRKGPIRSDDSQVQDQPSLGKLLRRTLRYDRRWVIVYL